MNQITIYKYRDFERDYSWDILFKREIYFSKISQLNDPFDSRITFNFNDLSQDELECYIDKLSQKYAGNNPASTIQSFRSFLHSKNKNYFELINQAELEISEKMLGVFSASLKWNNILMWSHYSNNHTGFVVGFNEEVLRNSKGIHFGGKVGYPTNRKFPRLNPMDDDNVSFFKRFFIKSKDWKYESEFRLINQFLDDNEKRIFVYPKNAIQEVILGMDISEINQSKILDFCKSNRIPVFKTYRKPFEFNLFRMEVV